MFPNLKLQIFRRGSHQNQLAKAVGMDETVLSKIIHGYRTPTVEQRKLLSGYLEADEAWLFERFETTTKHVGPVQASDVPPSAKAEGNGGD
ncbi:MAG: helix-turn-helix transcriptional regulator [Candidatus Acidiferrum sp.]